MTDRDRYCHDHSKYDCQQCADEILSLGIQADKDEIASLRRQLAELPQAVMRASITAYKEALNGIEAHPGNTKHEQEAWEWGLADRRKLR